MLGGFSRGLIAVSVALACHKQPATSEVWTDDPMSGHWTAAYSIGGELTGEYPFTLRKTGEIRCKEQVVGGCLFHWVFDNTNVRKRKIRPEAPRTYEYEYFEVILASEQRFQFNRASRAINSLFRFVDLYRTSENTFEGNWYHRENSGFERWKRHRPIVSRIEVAPLPNKTNVHPWRAEADDEIIVEFSEPYSQGNWGKNAKLSANRPGFRLNIYGDFLWGFQQVEFVDAIDFEPVTYTSEIFSEPLEDGKRPVVGVSVDFRLWHHATPGEKTLRINGQDWKLRLEVPGWPRPQPKLTAEHLNHSWGIMEGVTSSDIFRIRATFEDRLEISPSAIEIMATNERYVQRQMSLRPTSDPEAFVTEWMSVHGKNFHTGEVLEELAPHNSGSMEYYASTVAGEWIAYLRGQASPAGPVSLLANGSQTASLNLGGTSVSLSSRASSVQQGKNPAEVGWIVGYLSNSASDVPADVAVTGLPVEVGLDGEIQARYEETQAEFPVADSISNDVEYVLSGYYESPYLIEGTFRDIDGRLTQIWLGRFGRLPEKWLHHLSDLDRLRTDCRGLNDAIQKLEEYRTRLLRGEVNQSSFEEMLRWQGGMSVKVKRHTGLMNALNGASSAKSGSPGLDAFVGAMENVNATTNLLRNSNFFDYVQDSFENHAEGLKNTDMRHLKNFVRNRTSIIETVVGEPIPVADAEIAAYLAKYDKELFLFFGRYEELFPDKFRRYRQKGRRDLGYYRKAMAADIAKDISELVDTLEGRRTELAEVECQ